LQQKIVDRVLGDYRRLVTGPRLGAEDRQRLESHMSFLSEIEGRLKAPASASCGSVAAPAGDNLDKMVDVVVAALRCGRTRIALLKLGALNPFGISDSTNHNAHHANSGGEVTNLKVMGYQSTKVAALMSKLDGVLADPGTGQTLLDMAAVYWSCESGATWGSQGTHNCTDRGVVLGGRAGGFLKTGNYVDYRTPTGSAGRPINELLVTLLQAMGLRPDEYEKHNPGAVEGFGIYDGKNAGKYASWSQRRAALPVIT
jgi:hypothetical protein